MKYFYNESALPASCTRPRIVSANEAIQEPGAELNEYSIVVTRPAFHADTLPRRVIDRNMKCTVLPLLEILPASDPPVVVEAARNLQQYALVVFVSPSSVSAFISFLDAWPLDVAIGVVGKGSAHRLKQYGFSPNNTCLILPAPGETSDSESLLRQLDLESLKGKRWLSAIPGFMPLQCRPALSISRFQERRMTNCQKQLSRFVKATEDNLSSAD